VVENGSLILTSNQGGVKLNGQAIRAVTLKSEEPYPLIIGKESFVLLSTNSLDKWGKLFSPLKWNIVKNGGYLSKGLNYVDLQKYLENEGSLTQIRLVPEGMTQGFEAAEFLNEIRRRQ